MAAVRVPWSEYGRHLHQLNCQITLENTRRAVYMVSGVGSNVAVSFQVAEKSFSEILENIEDLHVDFAIGDTMQWKFPDTSDWASVDFNRETGYLQLATDCKTVIVDCKSNRFAVIWKLLVNFSLSLHPSHSELECYITDIQVSLYLNAGLLFHLFNLYDFVGENLGNAVGQCSKNIAR